MEAGFREDEGGQKYCSKLLELAATDDVSGFIHEVEKRGCDIDEVSFWYGRSFGTKRMGFEQRTPLMIASLYGSTEVLKYILHSGKVDVNQARGTDGATALHCAAGGGSWSSVEVVRLLIDAAGDIYAVDADGKRPADLIAPCVKSSTCPKRKTLEMLLNGGSDQGEDGDEMVMETVTVVPTVGIEKREYPMDIPLPDINNGLYGSDEFRMYNFKVNPCSRAYSHDWTECPFVHPGENARRRDPRKYHYTCVPCPEFKKGSCTKGDACEYAHGVFESWLHPAQYRTRLCKDETGCMRKVCFFAHKPEELRPLYASTGSAIPSPKSVSAASVDMTMLSPLSLGSPSLVMSGTSTMPISPSVSSPMWSSKPNVTPPALQLPGSRLKATLSARDLKLDMELLGLEKIRTQQQQQQQQHRQQLIEEMANNLSSPYGRIGDLKPTNLDDVFGSIDPSLLLHLSPKVNNVTTAQMQSPTRQNMNQLRASYPSNTSRKLSPPYGFDSSAAVAAAVMNSRSSAFAKRSQSFVDRTPAAYRPSLSGSTNSPSLMPSKLSDWSSPDGKLDWGFNDEEANKLRKSASFGIRSGNAGGAAAPTAMAAPGPEVSWVPSAAATVSGRRHGGVHERMPNWIDQMYIEQEQMVA